MSPRSVVLVLVVIAGFGWVVEWNSQYGFAFDYPVPLLRNVELACATLALAWMRRGSGVRADLPVPRNPRLVMGLTMAVAVAVALPTLTLGYLGDDFSMLRDRGSHESVWQTLFYREGETWFRPVGWLPWRWYYQWSPYDGKLVHAVSIALFAVNCALVLPALRRLGVPRGVAAATGILYAFLPATLETVAWGTNQFSLFMGVFSLAAIAALPARPQRALDIAPTCGFALLAFWSKEESYLLPLLLTAALMGFRLRRLWRAMRVLWPVFLLLALTVAFRAWFVSGIGGYSNAVTGQSYLLEQGLTGPWLALQQNDLASCLFPMRQQTVNTWYERFRGGLLVYFCLYVGASAYARICIPRGLFLFAVLIAPTAPLLPIHGSLSNVRWLYGSSLGLAVVAAGFCASGWLRSWLRWIPLLTMCAAGYVIGASGLRSWRAAANAMETGLELVGPHVKRLSPWAESLVVGLPAYVDAIPTFNLDRASFFHRFNSKMPFQMPGNRNAVGDLGLAIQVDMANRTVTNYLDGPAFANLTDAPFVEFSFENTRTGLPAMAYDVAVFPEPTKTQFFAGSADGMLIFPNLDVPAGSRVVLQCPGLDVSPSHAERPIAYLTYATGEKVVRKVIALRAPFKLPDDTTRVRVDFVLCAGSLSTFKGVNVLRVP